MVNLSTVRLGYAQTMIFMPPRSKIGFFFKTLTLLIIYKVLELWYFTWIFYKTRPPVVTNNLELIPLPRSLTYFLKTFSLAKNFWTVSARVYIFHINISSGKAFTWTTVNFYLNYIDAVSSNIHVCTRCQ